MGKVTVKLWKSGEIPNCTEIINRAADRWDVGVRERKQQNNSKASGLHDSLDGHVI